MTGMIFSDLGQASAFMALDWVQELLHAVPWLPSVSRDAQFAAQVTPDDAQVWQRVQCELVGIAIDAGSGQSLCRQVISRRD